MQERHLVPLSTDSASDPSGREIVAADWDRLDWKRMYDNLTNPDIIAQNKRKHLRDLRQEEKKRDVGL